MRRAVSLIMSVLVVMSAIAAALVVSGHVAIVETHGTSMQPTYHQGDLVVVRRDSSYSLGEIAAYRLPAKHVVVLHRIVAADASGFVFKGDNNSSVDAAHPIGTQLVGRAVLHLPQGAAWLHRLTGPVPLSLFVLCLVATGGGAVRTAHRRRRRSMSRQANRTRAASSLGALSPALRRAAGVAVSMAVVGATLGVLAWSGPVTQTQSELRASDGQMTFSYSAQVPRSAAYDGTTVVSPDPIFRKLANDVTVRFSYEGSPASIAVSAELSTPGGWHSTIPLASTTQFLTSRYTHVVRLDLTALTARAHAAAGASGLPESDVSVSIRPVVTAAGTRPFTPELALVLSPLRLALVGEPTSLHVRDSATTARVTTGPRVIALQRWQLTAAALRVLSAGLLVLAALVAAGVALLARRQPLDEGSRLRRRYAPLLVRVAPVRAPANCPAIDVPDFQTLLKLAERYGLLILHWSRRDVDTFIVQDERATFRYRTGEEAVTQNACPASPRTLVLARLRAADLEAAPQ
jgi:signal peptidase I